MSARVVLSSVPGVGAGLIGDAGAPATGPALSVVIPTRNEEGNIERLVERLGEVLASTPAEILFVDDSDDGTLAAIDRARSQSRLEVRAIHRPPGSRKGGLGGAVVEGMRTARAPWICVMDADLQHPPEVIARLAAKARDGLVDLVAASRFGGDGSAGEFGPFRRGLSWLSAGSATLVFRRRLHRMTDPMSGFFMVRRAALDLDALQPSGFKILLEIVVRTPGLRVAEVPFEFGTRYAGDSKASVREGARYLAQLWRLRLGDLATHVGRFGLVGATGLVVNTVVLAALADLAGLYYVAAAVFATQASTLWNFTFTELWVFSDREHRGRGFRRMAMFFLVNNLALALRVPVLIALTAGLGIHYVVSNLLSLALIFAARFTLADLWIWAKSDSLAAEAAAHNYNIHGLVTVASHVALPELARFKIPEQLLDPTVSVRIGRVRRGHGEKATAGPATSRISYLEGRGSFGFGASIQAGDRTEVVASPLLGRSPHVLYTNVVEPILRWTFAEKGYALVHAACIANGDDAYLITAKTDTGKTTTCLKTLDGGGYRFVSDDLTLLSSDGRVLTYPKPLTISRHTMKAVNKPLLSRRERLMLLYQSRLHSRSGRRFAMILARTRLPAATLNAIVQLLVPPPKYQVDRLLPHVQIASEANLARMIVIERGGGADVELGGEEALELLLANCEDAYGFPPYAEIEHFLHSRNGCDLRGVERATIACALGKVPTILLKSETMDWHRRVVAVADGANGSRLDLLQSADPGRPETVDADGNPPLRAALEPEG
ncbi:MAG TPA: glycosyltransferase family 2 protein [Thermoleophilaceae bacterium]